MKTRALYLFGTAPLAVFLFSILSVSHKAGKTPSAGIANCCGSDFSITNNTTDTTPLHSCRFPNTAGMHEGENFSESSGNSGTAGNIDVLYHKIYWRINPDSTVKYIKGSVQTNFKTIQANVSSVSFDLRSTLTVDSVVFRNAKLPAASITSSSNILTLNLGVTMPLGFIDSLTIYYQGVPPAVSGAAQGYQRGNNSGAGNYITTLSESYEDRDWWPCKADMQDKIDSMDITVNVPWASPAAADTFWVACNGKLVDSTITGGNRSFVFKNRYPMASYLVFVSVARYNRFHNAVNVNGTIVPVVYNLFRGKTAATYNSIVTAMDRMNTVLSVFSTKFGDYPFKNEKHGYYDGLLGAGGMEHQTMSGMNTGSLTSTVTLVHELGHQWFGDNVTFSTWNDLWLAEGFANYSEALAAELVPSLGLNAFSLRSGMKSSALSSTVSAWIPDGNIGNSNLIWNSGYGNAVYVRGAMIVSMLRAIAGDAKFYEALTNYQAALAGKSATGDSLKNHFNTVLGRDITVFFNDYVGGSGNGATPVGGKGNPVNTINWNSPTPNRLLVQVGSQTQVNSPNVSYFRGPVVLHVKGSIASQDTTLTFFDWGGGNLSYAGNGLSAPISGNKLGYNLSFTPITVIYDDSARTLSTGSTVLLPTLNDGGFTFNAATGATASCPAPASMSITIGTAANGGFTNPITLSAVSGVPAGTFVSFNPNPVTPGNSSIVTLNNTNLLAAGTYNITIQGIATGATAQTTVVTYTITPGTGPAITASPVSQSVCDGANASFSVTATGAATYQWQVSTNGGSTWSNINGAIAASYTIPGVTVTMNGNQYRCIAGTQCGSTTSTVAVLTVNTGIVITAQPQSAAVCSGSSNTLCVTASGSNLTYQWQISLTGCAGTWTNISGATSSCYMVNNIAATGAYRCMITSASCGGTVTSACAVLTVINPVVVASHPADATVCAGSPVTFTTSGSSTLPVVYQWQVSIDGGTVYSNISGANGNSYTILATTIAMNNNRYRCQLSNTVCTTTAATNGARLTVRALPSVTLAAAPLTTLLPGQTTVLTVNTTGTGGTLGFVWTYNNTPLLVAGNSYTVNVEHTGSYQIGVQESWPGGLICTNQSGMVAISATASSRLFIYPSPNDGNFTVSYYNSAAQAAKRKIVIFDAKGALVYQQEFTISGPYTLLSVNMSAASRGIYQVVIGDEVGKKLAEGKVHIR